jgi:glycosyltransferase involved in cell wall biosynthesis
MGSSLRLAIFTETFLPKVDGIVTVTCKLLDHLRDRGAEVILFAPGEHPESYAGFRVVSVPGVPFPMYPELILGLPGGRSFEILQDFNPNIVHVMNPVFAGLKGLRFAKQLNVPVVASFQAHVMEMVRFYHLGIFQEPLWAIHRYIYSHADYCLAPSQTIVSELQARGFGEVGLWRRGVDIERFNPSYADPAVREELSGGNPDKVLLLSVGRLAAEKQVEHILQVLDAVPNTHLAIVGDGPHREKLESVFAGRSVTFTGYKSGEDLSRAYASSDIFMFPSSTIETFGLVAAEAMASGLSTVNSRVGGVPELIENGVNGYYFEPGDHATMIEQVRDLVENPEKRSAMGKAARERACQLSWPEVMGELAETYERIIATHSPHQAERAS